MARSPSDRKPSAPTQRRARGFQRASSMTRAHLERIAGKNGFAEADVLLHWPEIVGADHAAKCRPVKVTYRHRSHGATLVVQTDSARAPEIEHQKSKIVERVNQFYGYRAIRKLKVTQSTGLGLGTGKPIGFAEEQTPFDGPSSSPTPEEERRATAMADEIETPGLKAALSRMGAHVLAQSRRAPRGK